VLFTYPNVKYPLVALVRRFAVLVCLSTTGLWSPESKPRVIPDRSG
jgi:hypothetical protein